MFLRVRIGPAGYVSLEVDNPSTPLKSDAVGDFDPSNGAAVWVSMDCGPKPGSDTCSILVGQVTIPTLPYTFELN